MSNTFRKIKDYLSKSPENIVKTMVLGAMFGLLKHNFYSLKSNALQQKHFNSLKSNVRLKCETTVVASGRVHLRINGLQG